MKHGKIRRSQTLLGSTVGSIDNPNLTTTEKAPLQWVQEQRDSLLKELFYTLYNPNQK